MESPERREGAADSVGVDESWLATLRSLPRAAWVVFVGTFINRIGTFVIPFLTLHVTKLGVPENLVGLPLAGYGVGALISSVVGGHLADSIGRRNSIALSMFLAAVSMVSMVFATGFIALIALAALTGFTSELYRPASSALLTDLVSPERRVIAFSAYRWFINAGWAVGPILGGVLAAHSYKWLFIGDAITSVAYGVLALVALPQLRSGSRPGLSIVLRAGPETARSIKMAFAQPNFPRFWFANFLIALVFMQMAATVGLEVMRAGFDETFFGMVLALNGVLIVIFELPISGVTRKLSAPRMIAWGYLMMGFGFGAMGWWHTAVGFLVCMVIFTIGEMVAMPVAMAYVAGLAPETERGRFMGVYGLSFALAFTLAPSLGVMMHRLNPQIFWTGLAFLGSAGFVLMRGAPTAAPMGDA